MLLDKPVTAGTIISIKLASGEELMAEFLDQDGTELIVAKPMMLMQSSQGVGLVPWMMTANPSKLKLRLSTIVTFLASDIDIAKAYTQSTTSIQLVK